MSFWKIFLLFFILYMQLVYAQIPKACVDEQSNQVNRICCPDNCGFPNGSCVNVSTICKINYSDEGKKTDSRFNWPKYFFDRVCKCNENYAGFNCKECKFGYGGENCNTKLPLRERRSINEEDMNWNDYNEKIKKAKSMSSRYVIILPGPQIKDISVYDLFVWIHHFAAKNNEDKGVDYAHESSGFLTWHRLFLLWFEREMQIALNDSNFSVHYWNWTVDSNRNSLFDNTKLGGNNNGDVTGPYYGSNSWKTVCWGVDTEPPCDPDDEAGQHTLRRCPSEIDCDNSTNWPTKTSVEIALSYDTYAKAPFSIYSTDVLSNYLEGFEPNADLGASIDEVCANLNSIKWPYTTCGNNEEGEQTSLTRKLHNLVHIILGIGSFHYAEQQHEGESGWKGTMGESGWKSTMGESWKGTMADVAASPNDPVFINHHTMIDCVFEKWLQNHPSAMYVGPTNDPKFAGHGPTDCIVPFIPLYTHEDMFQTASNLGYYCSTGAPKLIVWLPIVITFSAISVWMSVI